MKAKTLFLIPILILFCAGATMCSPKNDPPSGDTASNLLGFSVGPHTFYLLKAADSKRLPKGKFLGKDAYRKAAAKASVKAADKVLLLVLVPSEAKGSRLTLESGGKKTPLAAPVLIYRMPDSPAHTYAVVDAHAPGSLTVTTPDGITGGFDLEAAAPALAALPYHWEAEEDGYLSYKHLPKGLHGKLPR